MRWQGRKGSSNIEDRRGGRAARAGGGAGLGILLIVVVGWLFGVDASFLLDQENSGVTSTGNV
ncbi:MAG: neutral zinc metallopeptidase, partial [Ruegeria sp.]|nr:neutral zinc metallopeptidase [Ruegeria sp.]